MVPRTEWKRKLTLVLLALATIFVIKGLLLEDKKEPPLQKYAHGIAEFPFQSRILMMPVIRMAYQSPRLARLASHRSGPFHDPGVWPVAGIGLICITLTGLLTISLYKKTTVNGQLHWLVYPAFLAAIVVTFTMHDVSDYLCVYDLPSLFFFTAGIWLAWERRFWWLVLLLPFATLNRETTLFLIPVAALMQLDERWRWKKIEYPVQLVLMLASWVIVTRLDQKYFPGVGTSAVYSPTANLKMLANPMLWDEIFAATGFLWAISVFNWKRIPNKRLQRFLLIYPLWFAVMLFRGILTESRIYEELIPISVVMAVLVLESPKEHEGEAHLQTERLSHEKNIGAPVS